MVTARSFVVAVYCEYMSAQSTLPALGEATTGLVLSENDLDRALGGWLSCSDRPTPPAYINGRIHALRNVCVFAGFTLLAVVTGTNKSLAVRAGAIDQVLAVMRTHTGNADVLEWSKICFSQLRNWCL